MSARTAYWRAYNRKNAEKKRAQGAAFRERNREKINAEKRAARAAGKVAPRKVAAVRTVKSKVEKPRADEGKDDALLTLREKFAAFRAARAEGRG